MWVGVWTIVCIVSLQFPEQCSFLPTPSSQGGTQNRKPRAQELIDCLHNLLFLLLSPSSVPFLTPPSLLFPSPLLPSSIFMPCSQLQSLVARTQCGDFLTVLNSLLKDRRKQGDGEEGAGLLSRSVYREILFLKSVLSDGNIDVGRHTITLVIYSISQ